MQLASLALAAVALVSPATVSSSLPLSQVMLRPSPVLERQSQRVQMPAERQVNRRFGLGANISMSLGEAGGAFRYWFGDRAGLDMSVLWAHRSSSANVDSSSTLIVAPSLIYLLRPYDDDRDVNLLPYVGGGVNYARQTGRPAEEGGNANGAGGQLFGGVELSFHDAPNVVISMSVVRYFLPDDFFGIASSFDRTQLVGSVYLYF